MVDSGVNDHPLLEGVVTDRLGVPADLGTADDWAHGTKVAGIAAYGDVRERDDARSFASPVRIISVRVVNAEGKFPEGTLLPEQMRQVITLLAGRGYRVINMSLGDASLAPYAGGRASPWASELDTLARELNVVIVVPAGNAASAARAPLGATNDSILTAYPAYLMRAENRLVDPATANVIKVGALARVTGHGSWTCVMACTCTPSSSPSTRPIPCACCAGSSILCQRVCLAGRAPRPCRAQQHGAHHRSPHPRTMRRPTYRTPACGRHAERLDALALGHHRWQERLGERWSRQLFIHACSRPTEEALLRGWRPLPRPAADPARAARSHCASHRQRFIDELQAYRHRPANVPAELWLEVTHDLGPTGWVRADHLYPYQ